MDSDSDERVGAGAGAGAGGLSVGGDTDDVSLPKATINKLLHELLPPGYSVAKEAKDLIADCCKEFVLSIASEANEICEKDSKKTLAPDHIIKALEALGFEDMVQHVSDQLVETKILAKDERHKKAKRAKGSGMSAEEAERIQEELFAASRARLAAGAAPSSAGPP
ncbi:BQ5605_C037g11603 [Microbotryum silenes-dioicae]|uniref:BQ5605_C037g11603 protein n=1 Tax=Microbotryum silenes-dioicae TaxID=796604 RepID=A0A2X0MFD8_9BASI|nr:BQ5605_C037g11603 [Microbotryum silenes-dioicae]